MKCPSRLGRERCWRREKELAAAKGRIRAFVRGVLVRRSSTAIVYPLPD